MPRQTLLVAEDLSTNFKIGEATLFAQFRGNKYEIFDAGLPDMNATLLENLVQNLEIWCCLSF